MNKYISRTLKFVALLIPLLAVLFFCQEYIFYNRTYDTERIGRFYEEEENSLDVVFIGASEMPSSFAPAYAYDKYGFTSYLYAMDANRGSLYLLQLKEILKHQSPEIIFVDLYGFLHADDATLFDEARLRLYSECIPFSASKVQTIMEFPCEDKLSYFFPLIINHNNLSILDDRLLGIYYKHTAEFPPSALKGAVTRTYIYSGSGDPGTAYDPATYKLTENSKAYLVEFLEYCNQNEIPVVFTNFPRNIADESNHSLLYLLEQAISIVTEYGYPVWNLQNEMDAIGIDKSLDYYNEHHMNIYGQVKLTDYIGSKVIEEFGLIPRPQSEENRQEWEQCANNTYEYIEFARNAIQSGTDITIHETANCWVFRNK